MKPPLPFSNPGVALRVESTQVKSAQAAPVTIASTVISAQAGIQFGRCVANNIGTELDSRVRENDGGFWDEASFYLSKTGP